MIALYQDNSPSTALLVEVDYIKGDKEKFYRFLKAFRSYLLGSSYDDVMLDIYLQKRKFIPFLSTESFYKEYVHGMLSIIQHNKRMDLKLYGLKQLMLALTTCKQYLLGSMLAEEVIIVTEALLTITGKESYLHELTIVSMCVMLEQRELRVSCTIIPCLFT